MPSFKVSWVTIALLLPQVAQASEACDGVARIQDDAGRNAFRAFVTGALTEPPPASQIVVDDVLRQGAWTIVGAEIPDADGVGYFLYQERGGKQMFYGIWGGMADPSEAAEVAKWATDQGAPAALARCFASMATAE
ncbi:hypothetical protein VB636_23785 [Paracoccus sp. APAP_BH8]|uniref:hypothetical protein n=1 Tax=Paracoccus sp. APAP_BH8 TaxID=3110237 RepID=UPI002FD7B9B9